MAVALNRSKAINANLLETRLRVMTWNLWWRYGPWRERRDAIAETLRRCQPDIVALQEVWDDGGDNLAEALAEPLSYQHVYAQGETRQGLSFGNAVLSRWPIVRSEARALCGRAESGEGRCVLFAEIGGPRGPVQLFSTHLNWRFDQSHIRQRQVGDIARFVAGCRPRSYPAIVCGDFNAEPQSEEIRMMTGLASCPEEGLVFRDAWREAGDGGPGHTWDNRNDFARRDLEPDRRIDYVFAGWPKARGAGQIIDCRLAGDAPIDGLWPSDHFAVLAELRY